MAGCKHDEQGGPCDLCDTPGISDSEMMDWLGRETVRISRYDLGSMIRLYNDNGRCVYESPDLYPDLRSAVRAAMKAEKEGKL